MSKVGKTLDKPTWIELVKVGFKFKISIEKLLVGDFVLVGVGVCAFCSYFKELFLRLAETGDQAPVKFRRFAVRA